jgi:uncharacterized protein (TIGR00369 family)
MTGSIFDSFEMPPIAGLLGWKLIGIDTAAGTIEVEFLARSEFTNPSGFVQGGMIAAMLDDTLGPAAFAMTGGKRMTNTIDLHIHYLRPVRPGRVTARAKVVRSGARIAFLAAELFDAEERLSATATASAMMVDFPPA